MKYLKIQNDGVLDIRLVALMGGTTKANDKFKIGQFGTGLKYTLAFLYRNNLDFKIFAGTDEITIHTEKELIRDETFEIICINNQRTSITTQMGEDWLAWMIIRELWCNALDEGGAVKDVIETCIGEENKTTFFIQIDAQIQNVLKEWDKYFIHEQNPIWENHTKQIQSIIMQPKNLQTEEQLSALAEKVHAFLILEVHTDDIEVAVQRGHELAAYMANTGKALADSKYWKDRAVSNSILSKLRDTKVVNLPASVMNELIKADTKDHNYLVNWFERLDRECTHQLDWLRTVISKAKEEMRLSSYQQS